MQSLPNSDDFWVFFQLRKTALRNWPDGAAVLEDRQKQELFPFR